MAAVSLRVRILLPATADRFVSLHTHRGTLRHPVGTQTWMPLWLEIWPTYFIGVSPRTALDTEIQLLIFTHVHWTHDMTYASNDHHSHGIIYHAFCATYSRYACETNMSLANFRFMVYRSIPSMHCWLSSCEFLLLC